MKPVVWITGAGGLIGDALVRSAVDWAPEFEALALTRDRLELTDSKAVADAFRKTAPQAVVHCAALSRTVECDTDPARARRVNVDVTRELAERAADIPFIFFSTDLVFDGASGGYAESDPVHPLSVYGSTKAEAEAFVLENPRHTVLRTSLNGGISPSGNRGFNEEMRNAWKQGRALRLFVDEFRSPIPASATARAVWELVAARRAGLYHLAGSERLSRFEIGELVAARWPQLNPRIEAASLTEHKGSPRPPDTSLKCEKIQRLLSFPLPGLREWLRRHPDEPF